MKKILQIGVLLVFSFLFCLNNVKSQITIDKNNEARGWNLGLNFGGYYVSKYTANYYNGSELNENKISYIFSNYYWYQDIYNMLYAHDTLVINELPTKMKYNIAVMPGLFFQYNFNELYSLTFQFNYLQIKAKDVLSIEVDPKTYPTFPDIRLFSLQGHERRMYIDVALRRNFLVSDNFKYFVSAGVNINSTKVLKSFVYIEGREFSLINIYGNNQYIPNTGNQEFNIYQGGIGFGANTQVGVSFIFPNALCVEGFLTAHHVKVNLENYKSMRPGFGFGVRFIY